MSDQVDRGRSQADRGLLFERAIWPHLTTAYNFARWMVRNHHDAEDIVQEAFVKALNASGALRGADARPWLLAIVRNSAINFLSKSKRQKLGALEDAPEPVDPAPDPERSLATDRRRNEVRAAIDRLPIEFREALLLREMEDMPYKEIAHVLDVPIGTVMSRLSRARALLVSELVMKKEAPDDLR